jgi:uncharacterized membrane protein YgcG
MTTTTTRRIATTILAALTVVLTTGAARQAQTPGSIEHIDRFNVSMTVSASGLLTVHEEITWNFGSNARHGIFRDIPVREIYETDTRYDRVYRVRVTRVTADDASTPTKTSTQGRYLHLRIGDPNRTITGAHRYAIDYTVRGAPTGFADHDELFWDAIGLQFPVPIDNAAVDVQMPARIARVACSSGSQGSRLGCDEATTNGQQASFAQRGLQADQGMTIVVGLPKGTIVPPPAPILEKRWNLNDAFARRGDTTGAALGLALLTVGGVLLLAWRRGRDRRFTGSAVDQAMGNTTGEETPIAPFAKDAGPVEFIPPDNIRPGQVGLLIDENVNVLDVTATIIDLAVRHYIRITELPSEGLFHRRHDYELTQLDAPANERKPLMPYEQQVLSGLFTTGSTVKLSELKYKFRANLAKIRDDLYDDAVSEGWYRTRPDKTRAAWTAIAITLLVGAGALTYVVARYTSYGLVPLALVLAALVLLVAAHRMPSRTGKGSAVLSRVRGFRRLFDEGDEDLRSRFAEQHNIFSEYLPYAIVFGCTQKWAKAFEGLDEQALGTSGWYAGHTGLNALVLASAIDDFGTVATGTLYASQPSSSGGSGFGGGGFSGGGGGGGGGGSW